MILRLIDSCDNDCQYGILTVENLTRKEVQNKIYEIKNRFYEEGNYSWCVDDALEEFPEEWKWDYIRDCNVIEI